MCKVDQEREKAREAKGEGLFERGKILAKLV